MTFLIQFSVEGNGEVMVEANDRASAEAQFDALSLEELLDNTDFTGGIDVLDVSEVTEEHDE